MHTKSYKDGAGKILLGTTFIKAFSNESSCPKYLHAIFIAETHKTVTTEAMLKGLYFEQNVIGSTSSNDGTIIELPKLKSGKKSVEEERIDMQIRNFPQVLDAYGIRIEQTQVPLYQGLNEYYGLGTVIDIKGTIDDPQYGFVEHAVFDVKLTENIKNTFGDFQWGEPERRDHTQAVLSAVAYNNIYGVYPKFYYLVFGYNTEMGYDVIEKSVSVADIFELTETVRVIFDKINEFAAQDWPTNPTFDNCRNCPLQFECDQKIQLKPIVRL